MDKKFFCGKPVIFCGDDLTYFYFDLLNMVDDNAGPESVLRRDKDVAYHFQSLRKRLAVLLHDGECSDWVVVGLGEPASLEDIGEAHWAGSDPQQPPIAGKEV